MPATPAGLVRRFALLSALRWFPVGLTIPVNVLLMQARGLDLAAIGGLYAIYGVVTDRPGAPDRRPRRRDSVGARSSSRPRSRRPRPLLVAAVAQDIQWFALAMVLGATGRALGSGPLDAWYVDATHALDPEASVRQGLARGQAAEALALGLGAVIGGLLPAICLAIWPSLASGPVIGLSVPVLARRGHDRRQRRRDRPGRPRAATGLGRRPGDRRRDPEHDPRGPPARVRRSDAAPADGPGRPARRRAGRHRAARPGDLRRPARRRVAGQPGLRHLRGGRVRGQRRRIGARAGRRPPARRRPRRGPRVVRGRRRPSCWSPAPILALVGAGYVAVYLLLGVGGPLTSELLHGRVAAARSGRRCSRSSRSPSRSAASSPTCSLGAIVVATSLGWGFACIAAAMVAGGALLADPPVPAWRRPGEDRGHGPVTARGAG